MEPTQLTQPEIEALWFDRAYGVLTRPAFEIVYERRQSAGDQAWAILIDLDKIHNLNAQFASDQSDGYEQVDALVRQALTNVQIRSTDLLLAAGRYKSGDEIGFVIRMDGDPNQFCERLQTCLNEQGLSATMGYVKALPSFDQTFRQAGILVQQAKRLDQRGTVRSER